MLFLVKYPSTIPVKWNEILVNHRIELKQLVYQLIWPGRGRESQGWTRSQAEANQSSAVCWQGLPKRPPWSWACAQWRPPGYRPPAGGRTPSCSHPSMRVHWKRRKWGEAAAVAARQVWLCPWLGQNWPWRSKNIDAARRQNWPKGKMLMQLAVHLDTSCHVRVSLFKLRWYAPEKPYD